MAAPTPEAAATAPAGAEPKDHKFTFLVEPHVKASGPGSYGCFPRRMSEPEPGDDLPAAWRKMGGTIEAMSPAPSGTVAVFTKQNLLVKAVHAAFFDHHPLVLSPDVIWLTIAQGLAHHVDQNAEALRQRFVEHEGKKELVVERPGFVKGSPANDWEGVFPEFSRLIAESSRPGLVELIENDFTTTGPVERIVSHVALMDAVQHYFTYTMCCGCGFPSITLTGTPGDWEKIRAKAEQLRDFDLDWWLAALLPALDQFVQAAHGQPNLDFWRSLCMINVGLSSPAYKPLTGWIQAFFPYLLVPHANRGFGMPSVGSKEGEPKMMLERNTHLEGYLTSFRAQVNPANFGSDVDPEDRWATPGGAGKGVKLERFPPAMSSAPVLYKDLSTRLQHEMAFFGGVTCLVQDADGALEPKLGWAVLDSGRTR